jgi:hypothetical protein
MYSTLQMSNPIKLIRYRIYIDFFHITKGKLPTTCYCDHRVILPRCKSNYTMITSNKLSEKLHDDHSNKLSVKLHDDHSNKLGFI